ncbi:MAG: Rrf2 family transcriptional regulator [Bacteroidetes bacterium]|nr:Rrf2 family transcriptional regulator [Bacteroidota bacterium]
MFSKSCEYGIRAILYILTQSMENTRVKIGDIAENVGTPLAFTGKILGALTKYNIVNSYTGPNGGFDIDRKRMKEIKVSDIVYAIDGDGVYSGCALGLNECSSAQPCPLHNRFVKVRSELKNLLETTSVYDLALGLKTGKSKLL